MATYALQAAPHAGAQIVEVTPASGDLCPTGQGFGLLVNNPVGGTQITVAMPLPSEDGLAGPTRTVTIPAGQDWMVPMPDSEYGSAPVPLTYTGTLTNVLVAVVRIP